jgi:hypothetical protein
MAYIACKNQASKRFLAELLHPGWFHPAGYNSSLMSQSGLKETRKEEAHVHGDRHAQG